MKEVVCGDIGGTHANLCLAEINHTITLKKKTQESTAEYKNFSALILKYLELTKSAATNGCFAVAGPVNKQRVEMTNANLVIDGEEIATLTPLKQVLIINDFEALGYSTNVLNPDEIKILNGGEPKKRGMRAVIGAGTGLGKSILIYQEKLSAYQPFPSEGGHADLPWLNAEEAKVLQGLPHPTYEDLLSGRGLEYLYISLQKSQFPSEPKALKAYEISKNRRSSPCCQKVFKWFVKFYARCARNFAIDLLAKGGIFLGGGIVGANQDAFEKDFMEEFVKHPLPQFREILQKIPVTLITNYDVSLKGAAFALSAVDRGMII